MVEASSEDDNGSVGNGDEHSEDDMYTDGDGEELSVNHGLTCNDQTMTEPSTPTSNDLEPKSKVKSTIQAAIEQSQDSIS